MSARRPVRANAGEAIEVRLTVNGTPVALWVPARVTLADALREHLGLSGTHLGCEHGVCGMCTVLVDGEAARSCLLFAVQCDGLEVLTVEGLGTPQDQHPLQRAFSHHHALQCGFCTPGFLLSSYDLLVHRPDVREEELPHELSGVLCRCTGYRNILAAVADVADAYRDGVPGPRGCAARALTGRRQPGPARAGERTSPELPSEVVPARVPAVAPTATIDVAAADLAAPVERVWAVLDDVETLARCLPGADLTERLGGDRCRGRAHVLLGPIRLSFEGVAEVVEREPGDRRLRVLAQGRDAGGDRTQADIRLRAEPSGTGTMLRAEAAVYLSGRIAIFGRALAGDVTRRLFERFAEQVNEAAMTGTAPPSHSAAPSAFQLALGAAAGSLRRAARHVRDRLRHRSPLP